MRLSSRQFPDIYALKEDFARKLGLKREPEIYLMSGNGTLNAFAASTLGYDFVVIHSELFSNTYDAGFFEAPAEDSATGGVVIAES